MRVLVVNDAPLERAIFRRYALRAGCTIAGEAPDADAALTALDETAADLVVLDGRIPPSGCLEALVRLRELRPGLPVLVIVALEEVELLRAALREGAAGALARPLLPSQIFEQLRLVARRAAGENE